MTTKDSFSLPLIRETVDALWGARYFSTVDVDRAFWQIGVKEADKCKTAFIVDGKLYEFNVMPFGSMNAPSTFQRLMDKVLAGLTWKQCLVYIDDILIFSKTFDQHLKDIDDVLSRIIDSGLKLKPSKCNFADDEVDYLGFKLSGDGIQMQTKKIDTILKLQPPETNKNLFGFLCSINYYRTLIPNYGKLTTELYKLAESSKRNCQWTPLAIEKFDALKEALVTAPVLAFPDYNKQFIIQSDASGFAIGSVLLQEQAVDSPAKFRPIAFAGRKLTETEKRYSASERELLSITYAYEEFLSHIYDRDILIYTDHEPLVTMNKLKKPDGRLGRLFHTLQDVKYKLEYLPGASNHLPDFLSRSYPTDKADCNSIQLSTTINWEVEQSKDIELFKILDLIKQKAADHLWSKLKQGKRWIHEKRHLYISNGILKHSNDLVVCPEHMKAKVLSMHHDSPFAGHRGTETTFNSVRQRYFWIFMPSEVKTFCQSCDKCQRFNYSTLHNRAPLKSIEIYKPWKLIGTDFMGPFKTSRRGNTHIVIAIDYFTKYVEGAATNGFSAESTARFIFDNIICRHGMVEQILSDQGANFEAKLFQHLCQLLGIDKLHTSTYHASGNGGTERVNKTVKPNLAKFVNDTHDDWDMFLQLAISTYNCSYHETIKMTPYEAHYGRKPVLVADVIFNNKLEPGTKLSDISEYVKLLKIQSGYIHEMVKEDIMEAQTRQKTQYDKFIQANDSFQPGDSVKISNFRVKPGMSKAFTPKFLGPYTITNKLGDLNYRISAPDLKTEVVHYNRLKHYKTRQHYEPKTVRKQITKQPVLHTISTPQEYITSIIKRSRNNKCTTVAIFEPTVEYRIDLLNNIDRAIESVVKGARSLIFQNNKRLNIQTEKRLQNSLFENRVKNNIARNLRLANRKANQLAIQFASEDDQANSQPTEDSAQDATIRLNLSADNTQFNISRQDNFRQSFTHSDSNTDSDDEFSIFNNQIDNQDDSDSFHDTTQTDLNTTKTTAATNINQSAAHETSPTRTRSLSPTRSTAESPRYTEDGKLKAKCTTCGTWWEASRGLAIHKASHSKIKRPKFILEPREGL